MIDPAKIHRLIELRRRRDELDALLKECVKEEDALSLALAEDFAESGLQNMKTPTGETLYRHRSLNVRLVPDGDGAENGGSDKSYTAAHAALEAAGQGWMIKPAVAWQTLQSWVRDAEKNGDAIPPEVADHLKTWEEYRVRVRLGS